MWLDSSTVNCDYWSVVSLKFALDSSNKVVAICVKKKQEDEERGGGAGGRGQRLSGRVCNWKIETTLRRSGHFVKIAHFRWGGGKWKIKFEKWKAIEIYQNRRYLFHDNRVEENRNQIMRGNKINKQKAWRSFPGWIRQIFTNENAEEKQITKKNGQIKVIQGSFC